MKPKLLLLHGALGSAAYFKPLITVLEKQYELHTVNFSGHAGSKESSAGFSIAVFADEVNDYLNQNNLDKVNIFGYSMGGYVAVYLAHKHPEKIYKIFTLGTKWDWNPEISLQQTQMLQPDKVVQKVPQWAKSLEKLHGKSWPKLMQKTAQMMLQMGSNPPLSAAEFEQIATPILLTVGDKDQMVSIDETRHMTHLLPHAQCIVLKDVPHAIELIDVAFLAENIHNFF